MSNISKTINYFKRNGLKNTYYAIRERLENQGVPYEFVDISREEEDFQRGFYNNYNEPFLFSILVPLYETKEIFLREMIESCLNQTYPKFELILADASASDEPRRIIETYDDFRIKYVKVIDNKGIAENTNEALKHANGDYCALLDHDDLLTKNALFEMARFIEDELKKGNRIKFAYSDEDKCNTDRSLYFEPHYKEKINLDLILSNNYICHLAVIDTSLLKRLEFRGRFNGSQDYDLFLRVIGNVLFDKSDDEKKPQRINGAEKHIGHVNKVLYHWRCHESSTAFDPASKEYAYNAGKRAIEDFVRNYYGNYQVKELGHKGFYQVVWGSNIFEARPDVGAIGCLRTDLLKITSGIYNLDGTESFLGMNKHYSGYMHRAHLSQEVYALDIRTIIPAPCMRAEYDELMDLVDSSDEEDIKTLSINFANMVRKKGLKVLYMPNC